MVEELPLPKDSTVEERRLWARYMRNRNGGVELPSTNASSKTKSSGDADSRTSQQHAGSSPHRKPNGSSGSKKLKLNLSDLMAGGSKPKKHKHEGEADDTNADDDEEDGAWVPGQKRKKSVENPDLDLLKAVAQRKQLEANTKVPLKRPKIRTADGTIVSSGNSSSATGSKAAQVDVMSASRGAYAQAGYVMQSNWATSAHREPYVASLENLAFQASQVGAASLAHSGDTLVMWATMPAAARRFSVNISASASFRGSDPNTRVLLTVSARDGWSDDMTRKAGKSIVVNSFSDGAWHKNEKVVTMPDGGLPFQKNKPFKLKIQVTPKSFRLHVDDKPLTEFEHGQHGSSDMREGQPLFLVVPVKEEHFGDPEELIVHAVWWGHTETANSHPPPPPPVSVVAPALVAPAPAVPSSPVWSGGPM